MPQFKKASTVKLILPSYKNLAEEDQAWVRVRTNLIMGDIVEARKLLDDTQRGMMLLVRLIEEWNFVEADGSKTPITLENINKFEKVDYDYLDDYINEAIASQQEGLAEDEKKPSGATSIAVTMEENQSLPPQSTT